MRRRLHDLYRSSRGAPAHPDSPAGGTGIGHARPPRSTSLGDDHFGWGSLPHPDSPAGRHVTQADIARADTLERAECVREAVEHAQTLVGPYILQETGQGMKDLISGIVPTLLLGSGILALTTSAGAAGGAILGSLGMGIGAVPGSMFGGSAGFEAGMALLDALGLGFLFAYVSDKLPRVCSLLRSGLRRAWDAPDCSYGLEDSEIDAAARDIAQSLAVLFSLILQAIVAFLTAKGAQSAAERLPDLVGKLRSSGLGGGFAKWIEQNYDDLIQRSQCGQDRQLPTSGGGTVAKRQSGVWPKDIEETKKADAGAGGQPEHFTKIYERLEIPRRAAKEGRGMTKQEKIDFSEARGETNAFFYIDEAFPNYKQIQSFGKKDTHNFDGVWEGPNENLLIVESKGGDSHLARGQMSYEWLVDRANKLGPPVGDKILNALNNPNNRVQGIVLRTPKESGSAVMVETSPNEMRGIEDLDPDTGLIDYSATHKRRQGN